MSCEVHRAEDIANLRAAVTHHPGDGPKVLVVDDDPFIRRFFVSLLCQIAQFDIRDTGSSLAAIQAVRDDLPDIVTTDMMRPGMKGWETVERIRKIKGAEKVWIIAITAYASLVGMRAALAVGCDEYLFKPLDRESIYEAIIRGLVHHWMLDGVHGIGAFRACDRGRGEEGSGTRR